MRAEVDGSVRCCFHVVYFALQKREAEVESELMVFRSHRHVFDFFLQQFSAQVQYFS